jgi:hypothetical protein
MVLRRPASRDPSGLRCRSRSPLHDGCGNGHSCEGHGCQACRSSRGWMSHRRVGATTPRRHTSSSIDRRWRGGVVRPARLLDGIDGVQLVVNLHSSRLRAFMLPSAGDWCEKSSFHAGFRNRPSRQMCVEPTQLCASWVDAPPVRSKVESIGRKSNDFSKTRINRRSTHTWDVQ